MPVFTGGSSQVGSANITDGAIVNADVNASAGIELSKLETGSWDVLASVSAAGGSVSLNSGTFAARTLLRVLVLNEGLASGANLFVEFNADSGTNYARTYGSNGAASTVESTVAAIILHNLTAADPSFHEFDIMNIATEHKFLTGNGLLTGNLMTVGGRWLNTTDQITAIRLFSTVNINAGTKMIVYGANLP